jgi:hypothetical protein
VYHGRNGFPDAGEESNSNADQQASSSRFMTGLYATRTHLHSAVRMLEKELGHSLAT